jgi:pimeloyl-ACP methyl ester carboxylesterase
LLADGAPTSIDGIPEPTLLIHGEADQVVPPAQSTRVEGARVSTIPGLGHFELLDPNREHWPLVIDALDGVIV